MTEELFRTDSYLKECNAVVQSVADFGITLDRTVFYPTGGGQPGDTGTITWSSGSSAIVDTRYGDGGAIVHVVGEDSPRPAVGDNVHIEIDWERREQLMRTHTAMHILCGVVWRDYGAQVTGGNMEPLEGRMDFEFERMERELVDEIEAKINAEVEAARDVVVNILPRNEAEQIPDLDPDLAQNRDRSRTHPYAPLAQLFQPEA